MFSLLLFLPVVVGTSLPQPVNVTTAVLALRNVSIDTLQFFTLKDKTVQFRLVTRSNSPNYQLLNASHLAVNYSINASQPFKFIIHGWRNSANEDWVQNMRAQFLKKGDYNVILVDWVKPANTAYNLAARFTKSVGFKTATLIEALNRNFRVPLRNIHLIGHSLGAHISGFAGAFVKNNLSNTISRITGLDPAGPLFIFASKKNKLNPSDAKLVDVIHTDGNKYGYLGPLGTADFYPNGGVGPQPSCSGRNIYKDPVGCSHGLSHQYFTESISSSGFVGTNCTRNGTYFFRQCLSSKYKRAIMGENIQPNTTGIYYLSVNNKPPYARNGVIYSLAMYIASFLNL